MSWRSRHSRHSYGFYPAYVSVAEKRRRSAKALEELKKKGVELKPIQIEGRTIAKTFWGKGWCDHFESMADFANRLPRGRTYARNGSVCHLDISPGRISAMVSGSDIYNIEMMVKPLAPARWKKIKETCFGGISTMVELLMGKFSEEVMTVISNSETGLFPLESEITYKCSCPDWADLCKHVAAVFYGVGNRLDNSPELLFMLRQVDPTELLSTKSLGVPQGVPNADSLTGVDLESVFGIELELSSVPSHLSFEGGKQISDRLKDKSLKAGSKSISVLKVADKVKKVTLSPVVVPKLELVPSPSFFKSDKTDVDKPGAPQKRGRPRLTEPQEKLILPKRSGKIVTEANKSLRGHLIEKVTLKAPSGKGVVICLPVASVKKKSKGTTGTKITGVNVPKAKVTAKVVTPKGKDIKNLRLKLGLSFEDLAHKLDVSQASVRRWETLVSLSSLHSQSLNTIKQWYNNPSVF